MMACATMHTSVPGVGPCHIPVGTARRSRGNDWWDKWAARPRYVRKFVWERDQKRKLTSADAMLYADPVPEPPLNEYHNQSALNTISLRPDLFSIVTPINVDIFYAYLTHHPNRPFVDSVCKSLRQGFWPWANSDRPGVPDTYDNSHRPLKNSLHGSFVQEQRDAEVSYGQFSPSFGPDFLPGMYSMPIGVVPKPHSDKLRMVFDHSAEPYSLNAMIPPHERSVILDTLVDLGRALIRVRRQFGPDVPLVVFKSDVSRAYRLLPMHPFWQIKQIVTIGPDCHVDRCNQFGNGAAGRIFWCVIALVLWVAMYVKLLSDMFEYVDDEFSWEFMHNTSANYDFGLKAAPRT
jgi:hypothetical protein